MRNTNEKDKTDDYGMLEPLNTKGMSKFTSPVHFAFQKPTEFSSSNVWRQGDLQRISLDSKTERFQQIKMGGHFAETSYVGTSFNLWDPHVSKDRETVARETDFGRPLWLAQISKVVPPCDTYNIESTFGSKSTLLKTRAKPFLNMNPELNKSYQEEPQLLKFQTKTNKIPTEGVASYNVSLSQVKKKSPQYSQTHAKQHTTFDQRKTIFFNAIIVEIKRAQESPDPSRFYPNDVLTKTTRYEQRSMGSDIKSILKPIRLSPGPADYSLVDSVRPTTKNFLLQFSDTKNDKIKHSQKFSYQSAENTQSILNSNQFGQYYQSPRDGMFSRKVGHYPPDPVNISMTKPQKNFQQPPMCIGSSLSIPEVLVVPRPKHHSEVESKYSIKNLNELSLLRKLAFAESLTNRIAHNMTEVPSTNRLEKLIDLDGGETLKSTKVTTTVSQEASLDLIEPQNIKIKTKRSIESNHNKIKNRQYLSLRGSSKTSPSNTQRYDEFIFQHSSFI